MYSLKYANSAIKEIDALWQIAPKEAAVIAVALEDLETNQAFLSSMFMYESSQLYPEPTIHVQRIAYLWTQGYNILRLKIWNYCEWGGGVLDQRIICGYDGRETYYVLACLPREHAYAPGHPDTIRIMREYEELGLPRYSF